MLPTQRMHDALPQLELPSNALSSNSPGPKKRSGLVFAAKLFLQLRATLALLLLIAIFACTTDSFLTANNFTILIKQVSISALLAIGMTFVIIAGGIDLSVGSIVGLSGMIAGGLIAQGLHIVGVHYTPVWAVILAAVAVEALVVVLNGVLITRFGIAPFIATLGTLYIARGAAMLSSNGGTFPELAGMASRHNTGFPVLGQGFLLHVPNPVWTTIILSLLAYVLLAKIVFGRHVYAIGGNERAAVLAGIAVARVKLLTYVISGVCAAAVGLLIASQLEAAHPATGESFELTAIAAVVLGGTSLQGGRGSILGALLGACVIGVLADGLVMMGVSEFWQMVIQGTVIVLAVAIDQFQSKFQIDFAFGRAVKE